MAIDIPALLQKHSLKVTQQRLALLGYLVTHETHPTAEMIHAELPEISLATIYNTLDKLVEVGLVVIIEGTADGKRHYDFYGEPHYHIINTKTQEIFDANNFDVQPLLQAGREATGLDITDYHIELYGVDPDDAK
ncbi:Fur family transcriptional regulator [Convivina praedatoris]|uniref:Peroxide-responsive repressor PerR n=1 Tax=Convivina praedatoris TaxID=2880963 RepID=A0ABN8HBK2_9LACO|nr:Fur family transcriptional regulator [Convivina sp. LMG 32447]CAH1850206.1 Peroxide-responsive repressor PerR [Convivina sp. LMG 32447]CAH1850987.1 Peroxide-responsive repressor PerR [Convivina sp. LMG 32447]CAH1851000.1 Peroxide-responsive repressor PerR [Convivina sp. LMG 32447]